jgi:cytochrome c-type biogenesis protein CcmH
MIWGALGLLALLTLCFVLYPLLRREDGQAGPDRLEVFERQLQEIDRDEADGVIDAAEAGSARLEVKRRILAADREAEERILKSSPRGRRLLVLGAVAACLAGTLLYLDIGRPGLPDDPYQAPGLRDQADKGGPDLNALVDRLMIHLADNPEDMEGWQHFRRAAPALDRQADLARALLEATRARPENPSLAMLYAESLILLGEGNITPAADLALERVAALVPDMPALSYYRALGMIQNGEMRAAREELQALLARSPADAPWRGEVERQIARTERALGMASGPGSEAGAAIAAMSDEDRQAAIRTMVEGLAARMEGEPENLEGWQRLARAWQVLGERDKAVAAWAHVRDLADKTGNAEALAAASAALQALQAGP